MATQQLLGSSPLLWETRSRSTLSFEFLLRKSIVWHTCETGNYGKSHMFQSCQQGQDGHDVRPTCHKQPWSAPANQPLIINKPAGTSFSERHHWHRYDTSYVHLYLSEWNLQIPSQTLTLMQWLFSTCFTSISCKKCVCVSPEDLTYARIIFETTSTWSACLAFVRHLNGFAWMFRQQHAAAASM